MYYTFVIRKSMSVRNTLFLTLSLIFCKKKIILNLFLIGWNSCSFSTLEKFLHKVVRLLTVGWFSDDDAEFDREDHSSIICNCNQKRAETTWCQNWPLNQIKLVVKANKKILWYLFEFHTTYFLLNFIKN
jgi:hypothetical protein